MKNPDVVVVGAGFSCLRAATVLAAAGVDVVVIEARDRVGGKVESQLDQLGHRVDTGGQFVCDDMPTILDLVMSQGKELVDVSDERPGLAFVGDAPTDDPVELARRFGEGWEAFERLSEEPPPMIRPGQTAHEWLTAQDLHPVALHAALGAVSGMLCMPLDRLAVTTMIESGSRTPFTVGELQYIVRETMHQVAIDLAAALPHPVRLGCAVDRIDRSDAGVTVHYTDTAGNSHALTAPEVLLAIPPAAVPHIAFDPPLPADLAAIAASFGSGDVFKFMVRYERAFWHRDDLGVTRRFLDPPGTYITDASPESGCPTLVAFIGGMGALQQQRLTSSQRRERLLELLVEAYGTEAGAPVSFLERDWRPDRWGAGGYCNEIVDPRYAPPHADAVATLLAGAPGISFASTELAAAFPGYMEGALRAGDQAAAKILAGRAER